MACPTKAIHVSGEGTVPALPILFGHNLLDTSVKINVMIITIVGYVLLTAIFQVVRNQFGSAETGKLLHQTLHFTRIAYALLVIACGIDTVFLSSDVYSDVVKGRSVASVLISTMTFSYTVFDTATYLLTGWISGNTNLFIVLHHVIMLPFYWFCVATDSGYYFGSAFLLVEVGCLAYPVTATAGTPRGRTQFFRIYTIVALHFFHLRNFIEVYLWLVMYRNWDKIVAEMPTSVTIGFIVMLGVISILLTPLWTYFINIKLVLGNFAKQPETYEKEDGLKKGL